MHLQEKYIVDRFSDKFSECGTSSENYHLVYLCVAGRAELFDSPRLQFAIW